MAEGNLNNLHKNREISWLQFNSRVLQEAADTSVPLIERLRFLGIFSNNLDEFFKIRYAMVKRVDKSDKQTTKGLGGDSASALLREITAIVIEKQAESLEILSNIQKELGEKDIHIVNEKELKGERQQSFVRDYFLQKVSPALVTIILDDLDELPRLKDSSSYLAVKMTLNTTDDQEHKKRYILIEIPRENDRFIQLPADDGNTYVIILDDLIRYNLHSIFSIFDYKSLSAHMIKITRDAELEMEGDLTKSYIDKLLTSVKERVEGEPVRFVYDKNIEQDTLDYLLSKIGIDDSDSIIPGGRYHNRRDYVDFPDLGRKDLLYEKVEPLPIKGLTPEGSLLKKLAHRDFLQHAPYHTFSYTVRFLREAAIDPQVRSIKMTIYRLADISHIASSLINAVKNGKHVTVSIELRARFDEANNIRYAEQMQREGVKMIFGVPGLKVHAKACLVDRIEKGEVKRYGFLSTGNFNETTAKIYTDYLLFTTNQAILEEVDKVFEFFRINYKVNKYDHLIVSPHYSRREFGKLIDTEIENAKAGKPSGMKLKMNSLSDYKMIDKLYEASRAGVKVQLIVRGICCLIPGVKGMSENIEAISIVDKFLEHPRLYIFENNGDPKIYISSADWMARNLDHRVEISCPIYQEDIKQELQDTFEICWRDNVKARHFSAEQENSYRQNDQKPFRSQFETYDYFRKKLN